MGDYRAILGRDPLLKTWSFFCSLKKNCTVEKGLSRSGLSEVSFLYPVVIKVRAKFFQISRNVSFLYYNKLWILG